MSNTTTRLGYEIIKTASKYVTPNDICYEINGDNRGNCIDEIKCYYEGVVDRCDSDKVTNEPYCAIFAWTMVDMAIKKFDKTAPLWGGVKTKGAYDLLKRAKDRSIKVDNKPAIGSVFYRLSGSPTSSGHVGIVIKVEDDKFHTIEGNNVFTYKGKKYQGVWSWIYKKSAIPGKGFQFIHTETLLGNNEQIAVNYSSGDGEPLRVKDNMSFAGITSSPAGMIVGAIVLGTGAYMMLGNSKTRKS